jgi:hypothetical protein
MNDKARTATCEQQRLDNNGWTTTGERRLLRGFARHLSPLDGRFLQPRAHQNCHNPAYSDPQ